MSFFWSFFTHLFGCGTLLGWITKPLQARTTEIVGGLEEIGSLFKLNRIVYDGLDCDSLQDYIRRTLNELG